MTHRKLAAVSLATVMSASLVSSASALKMEFTPVVAHVTPLKSQVADSDATIVIRQESGTGFGARLGVWLAPRVAVEANMLIASSTISYIGGTQLNFDSNVLQLDLRGRLRVNDPAAAAGFDVIAGIGMSDLGDALSDFGEELGLKSPATFTFVIGIGATVPISDKVKLRFDVEDHIHDSNLEVEETAFGSPVDTESQNDIVIAAGIVIPLW